MLRFQDIIEHMLGLRRVCVPSKWCRGFAGCLCRGAAQRSARQALHGPAGSCPGSCPCHTLTAEMLIKHKLQIIKSFKGAKGDSIHQQGIDVRHCLHHPCVLHFAKYAIPKPKPMLDEPTALAWDSSSNAPCAQEKMGG